MALVCDVAQMYLRMGIAPKDQPYYRFLRRDLNQNQVPDHYELNRVVFGVNSCPFQAQFVTQTHTKKNKELYPRAAETVLDPHVCMTAWIRYGFNRNLRGRDTTLSRFIEVMENSWNAC